MDDIGHPLLPNSTIELSVPNDHGARFHHFRDNNPFLLLMGGQTNVGTLAVIDDLRIDSIDSVSGK